MISHPPPRYRFPLSIPLLLLASLLMLPSRALADSWCTSQVQACNVPTKHAAWLCFRMQGTTPQLVASHGTLNDSSTLLPANQPVTVLVEPSDDVASIKITQIGTMGVTLPRTLGAPGAAAAPPAPASLVAGPGTCNAYIKTFGARATGDATVSITVTEKAAAGAAPPTPTKHDFEAHVPKIYSGVFRLGVSAIYDRTLGDHYTTRQQPAGELHQIVNLGGSSGAIEMVVGYAPFFTLRTFTDAKPYYRLSPYLGLGVLSSTSDGVQWLRSVYLGVEFDLAQGCSVALTGVLRRSEDLADGLSLGDMVTKDTDVTRSTLSLGYGVVFNFTPEFLTFASSVIPK